MFVNQLLLAAERTPRGRELDALMSSVSGAYADGAISESDFVMIDGVIRARQRLPPQPQPLLRPRRRGSRPYRPESLRVRRQRLRKGWICESMVAELTWSEWAVLDRIGEEYARTGVCSLFVHKLGAFTGYCRTSVRNAVRLGEDEGWLKVKRTRGGRKNAANKITVVCKRWLKWIERRLRSRAREAEAKVKPVTFAEPTEKSLSKGIALSRDRSMSGARSAPGKLPEGSTAEFGPPEGVLWTRGRADGKG